MKLIISLASLLCCSALFAQDTIAPAIVKAATDIPYAMLYVYRPRNMTGSLINYNLHMGDTVICRVKNNSKFAIKLTKMGPTEIWAENEQKIVFKINVKPGRNYYIKCGIKMGVFSGRPEMNMVPEEVGEVEYEAVEGRNKKTEE